MMAILGQGHQNKERVTGQTKPTAPAMESDDEEWDEDSAMECNYAARQWAPPPRRPFKEQRTPWEQA